MAKKKIYRAGVVPYFITEEGEIMMLFMKPSNPKYGGKRFQLAKGKFEEGETAEEAGFREASEELGLADINILDSFKVGEFLGRTTVFAARIRDKNAFTETTDETEAVKWMTLDEFVEEGRELHKPVVKAVHRQATKKETKRKDDDEVS